MLAYASGAYPLSTDVSPYTPLNPPHGWRPYDEAGRGAGPGRRSTQSRLEGVVGAGASQVWSQRRVDCRVDG